MTMLDISRPIIVEGKYDKIKVLSVCHATVIETKGFGIFSDGERTALIRRLAEKDGVIVLTDSDGGGLVIRNYIKNILPPDKVVNLYIPRIVGKERRKVHPSKEGTLGVEGIDTGMLYDILLPYAGDVPPKKMSLTKADFYKHGLSGKTDSVAKRVRLSQLLRLPVNLSASALLEAVNTVINEEEYYSVLAECEKND
ncbi:MAG: DUF4093 domain-containing protein [Clostridia bacterium]|nr:DUF4093 domain-containing protein [Clostridia bacterium]